MGFYNGELYRIEVISVGPGKMMEDGKRSPMDVKAGDRVLFGKYAGSEIKIDDQEYIIMREEEILAVLAREKQTVPRTTGT